MSTGRLVSVRREARPLTNEELTDQQRIAIVDTVERLRILARAKRFDHTKPTERTAFLAQIDSARSNHVLMIEGARGSGKTSALATLLHELLQLLSGAPCEIGELARDPDATLLPLPILDVRPLPKDVPLLPMLLGSFQRVVDSLPESDACAKPGQLRSTKTSRALFDRVMHSATIGWSVPSAPTLSGEAAMAEIEMRRTDRLRRDLLPAFHEFMEQLAKEVEQVHAYTNPLFVIPVDDLDMNPGRTPEMLDLLRTLSHPRLAFVVTADRALMKATMLHEFMRDLNPMRSTEVGVVERASTLAIAHVAKVVPEENTSSLRPLDEVEAALLFVRLTEKSKVVFAESDDLSEWALPQRPRALQELAALVGAHPKRNDGRLSKRALVAALAWNREVEQREYGYLGWAERLRDKIRLRGDQLQVDGAMFVPRGRVDVPLSFRINKLGFGAALRMRWDVIARGVAVSEVLDVKDPTQSSPFDAGTDIVLPEPLPRLVMMAMNELSEASAVATVFAGRMADAPHVAVTHFERPAGVLLHLRWPTPVWTSVAQVKVFSTSFEHAIGHLDRENAEQQRAIILRAFLTAVVEAVVPAAIPENSKSELSALVSALRNSESSVAKEYVRDRLHLLATPEAGLALSDANEIAFACIEANGVGTDGKLAAEWTIDSRTLAEARRRWVGTALDGVGAGHMLEHVLAAGASGGLIWFQFQAENSNAEQLWQEFAQVLQDVHSLDTSRRGDWIGPERRLLFARGSGLQRLRLVADTKAMAQTRSGLIGLGRVLAELWRKWALDADRGLVIVDGNGVLRVQPDSVLSRELPAEKLVQTSDSVTLHISQVTIYPRTREPAERGSEWLVELIYRLAWDVSVMQSSSVSMPFVDQFGASTMRFDGIRDSGVATWFSPPVRLLSFWESLIAAWNALYARMVEERSKEEQQDFVNELALRWIRAFASSPSALTYAQETDLADGGVVAVVQQALAHGSSVRTERWTPALLRQFANDAPGLSRARRDAILAAIPEAKPEAKPAS